MSERSDYLRRRASEERDAADRCADGKVRDVHLELAARYSAAADDEQDGSIKLTKEPHTPVLPSELRILP